MRSAVSHRPTFDEPPAWVPYHPSHTAVLERRYRLMEFRFPKGPWRSSKSEAEQDAIRAGCASRDYGQVFMTVPAWIAMEVLIERA